MSKTTAGVLQIFALTFVLAIGSNSNADTQKTKTGVHFQRIGTTVVYRRTAKPTTTKAPSHRALKASQFATTADFVKYLLGS